MNTFAKVVAFVILLAPVGTISQELMKIPVAGDFLGVLCLLYPAYGLYWLFNKIF